MIVLAVAIIILATMYFVDRGLKPRPKESADDFYDRQW
jgi:hypothetical protein